MRAAWILLLMCLAASAARGGSEPKDELLSLLEEIAPVVSDANALAAPVDSETDYAAAASGQEAELAELPGEDTIDVNLDPNVPELSSEPNRIEPVIAETEVSDDTLEDAALEASRQLRRDFFRVQLEPVKTLSPEEQEQNLDALIARVSSLEPSKRLTVVSEKPETSEAAEPGASDLPLQGQPAQEAVPAPAVEPAADTEPNSTSPTLLTELKNAKQVVNAMQLADVLYRQGYTEAAYTYYKQAAEQLTADNTDNTQWVLFQMANCCCQSDPAKAVELYSDLLARFPNSPWSAAAQSRRTTLEWTMTESVKHFVAGGSDAGN